jgi:hypothetical protein
MMSESLTTATARLLKFDAIIICIVLGEITTFVAPIRLCALHRLTMSNTVLRA